jgi:hypothetical protein
MSGNEALEERVAFPLQIAVMGRTSAETAALSPSK